ncbi:hypothetical protein BJ322DRAFT_1023261 [Thelephora terrestris]|uniref:Uncharacterized protein n=1 Tax=Thelephora terrestris TaxID=56493 RepID=A0A9P6H7J5_9AGAM|nr:hypothetical protein BJ322DRAFT_1023261 [Thelephora terrestris]
MFEALRDVVYDTKDDIQKIAGHIAVSSTGEIPGIGTFSIPLNPKEIHYENLKYWPQSHSSSSPGSSPGALTQIRAALEGYDFPSSPTHSESSVAPVDPSPPVRAPITATTPPVISPIITTLTPSSGLNGNDSDSGTATPGSPKPPPAKRMKTGSQGRFPWRKLWCAEWMSAPGENRTKAAFDRYIRDTVTNEMKQAKIKELLVVPGRTPNDPYSLDRAESGSAVGTSYWDSCEDPCRLAEGIGLHIGRGTFGRRCAKLKCLVIAADLQGGRGILAHLHDEDHGRQFASAALLLEVLLCTASWDDSQRIHSRFLGPLQRLRGDGNQEAIEWARGAEIDVGASLQTVTFSRHPLTYLCDVHRWENLCVKIFSLYGPARVIMDALALSQSEKALAVTRVNGAPPPSLPSTTVEVSYQVATYATKVHKWDHVFLCPSTGCISKTVRLL